MAKATTGSGSGGTKAGDGCAPAADPAAKKDPADPAAKKDPADPAAKKDPADQAAKPYVVLARKYRPETFVDLIGQSAMVTTLSNAFASDRIAQGYMLTGVRGVGKTTTARILARALNYAKPGLPDKPTVEMPDYGIHCADIIASRHPDVVEMDAASNTGIDNIREIIESARYRPMTARTKVFIIDEVHMLSKGAFNALLKTLEEPPGHVKFIFATTEVRKVPVTVLSRCQRFDLRRVDVPELSAHFARITTAEGATAEPEALALIARAAEGSVRDGLSILDQAIAMGRGAVAAPNVRAMLGLTDRGRLFDLIELVFSGKAADVLAAYGALHASGADPHQLTADLAEVVHISMRVKIAGPDAGGDVLSAEEARRARALSERVSVALLSRAWQMLLKGLDEIARAPNARAAAEMLLIRLAYTADLPTPDEIIRQLGGKTATERRPGEATANGQSTGPTAIKSAAPTASATSATPVPAARAPAAARPVAKTVPANAPPPPWEDLPPPAAPAVPKPVATAAADDDPAAEDEVGLDLDAGPVPSARIVVASFEDVVRLASRKRDARLKIALEDHASLVAFETGRIEIALLPSAAPTLANELSDKLSRWTGERWVVAVSRSKGQRPLGEVRREREAAELAELKEHPAVQAVLTTFPGTAIKEIRELAIESEDDGELGFESGQS